MKFYLDHSVRDHFIICNIGMCVCVRERERVYICIFLLPESLYLFFAYYD